MEEKSIMQFGVHYMLDGYNCPRELLSNKEQLTKILENLPREMGMHPISQPVVVEVGPKNSKDSGGISGFIMIAESHISFHTFPNRGFVTIDVYTCQNDLDSTTLTKKFSDLFKFADFDEHPLVKRGVRYPTKDFCQKK